MITAFELATGPQLPHTLALRKGVKATPLGPLGARSQVDRVLGLLPESIRASGSADLATMLDSADLADPLTLIEVELPDLSSAQPGHWETIARPIFDRVRRALTLAFGEGFTPFAEFATNGTDIGVTVTLPRARGLRFDSTEDQVPEDVAQRAYDTLETDDRFSFLLSLYDAATRQDDPKTRVAHLYMCLEALAAGRYSLKEGQGSRDSVRMMRRYGYGSKLALFQIGDEIPSPIDHIGVAGRVRD